MTVIETYRQLVAAGQVTQDPAQELAVEKLEMLCHRLAGYRLGRRRGLFGRAEPEPQGLYLYGDVGRGKSMLMDMLFDVAPQDKKRRVHFHGLMQEVHEAIFRWRQMTPKERRAHPHFVKGAGDDPIQPVARGIAASATLLCFDEFQVSDVADAMILGRLFQALFNAGVVVVATSNRDPWSLYEGGLNRQLLEPFIALMVSRMDVHHLDSPTDYRLARLKGLELYHYPLDAHAPEILTRAFHQLADQEEGAPRVLEVKGRQLIVPEAARGVARFSFAELCEAALGAVDYLALAETFSTLILSDIPQMGKDRRNEAKRFVILIDVLYEHKVCLIASAEVPLEGIYPQGDGSFEFARTVSRLREMQGQDYLAR